MNTIKISRSELDIIRRTLQDNINDDFYNGTIEVNLDNYDVIVEIESDVKCHQEIATEFMGDKEYITEIDEVNHIITNIEIWDKDGAEQFIDDSLHNRLQKFL